MTAKGTNRGKAKRAAKAAAKAARIGTAADRLVDPLGPDSPVNGITGLTRPTVLVSSLVRVGKTARVSPRVSGPGGYCFVLVMTRVSRTGTRRSPHSRKFVTCCSSLKARSGSTCGRPAASSHVSVGGVGVGVRSVVMGD